MTTDPDLFADLVRSWDERDALELSRRSTGWYDEFVEYLAWQSTAADLRSAMKSSGDLDTGELARTIAERTLLALERGRPAEYALFDHLVKAVGAQLRDWVPVPGAVARADDTTELDVASVLKAKAQQMAAQAAMRDAEQCFAAGRLSACLESAAAVLDTLGAIPEEGRQWLLTHELVELRLYAIFRQAEAFHLLERFDRAAASYATLVADTSSAAAERTGWISEREFRLKGLSGLSAVARRRGQSELAVELAREASRLSRSWNGANDPATLNNLGMALLAAGRPHLALPQFRLARELRGPDCASAHEIFGQADCLRLMRDPQTAHRLYRSELERGLRDSDWLPVALFADRVIRGDLQTDDSYIATLQQSQSALPDALAGTVGLRLSLALATALVSAGRPSEAIDQARSAITRGDEVEPQSPVVLRLRVLLARALTSAPDGLDESRRELERVLGAVWELLDETSLDDRRSEIVGEWVDAYGAVVSILLTAPDSAVPDAATTASAFALHEQAKSPAFATEVAWSDVRSAQGREAMLRAVIVDLQDRGTTLEGIDARRLAQLDRVRAELRAVQEDRRRSTGGRLPGEPVDCDELADLLRAACPRPTAAVSLFTDATTTTAFVIRTDIQVVRVHRSPVGRAEWAALAVELRRAYNGSPEQGYPPVLRNKPWRRDLPAWTRVEDELWGIFDDLDGVEHIVFAPHGPTHALPLHALRTRDGDFLATRFTFSYTPSLTVLSALLSRNDVPVRQRPASAYVAGVAGRNDCNPQLFEGDEDVFAAGSWRCAADTGPAGATRAVVLEGIGSGADVVHLSCHGVFTPGRPGRSGLLFSDGRERPPTREDELSPVRRRRHLVSVQDLRGQTLSSRLVTLRACSSGLQQARNAGDEFEGLTRALLTCGARATLAALWNVDQRSSRELLAHFYSAWSTAGPADALAAAQRQMIESGDPVLAHPYHWAPFALAGDWR
jgi:tetratricopeptide (TPR) repeat protein